MLIVGSFGTEQHYSGQQCSADSCVRFLKVSIKPHVTLYLCCLTDPETGFQTHPQAAMLEILSSLATITLNSWLYFKLGCHSGIKKTRLISAPCLTENIISPLVRLMHQFWCLDNVSMFGSGTEASGQFVSAVRNH